jgi:hypothetical protein
MADDPDIETEKGRAEILKDMDATLRRMLNSPPKPHSPLGEKRKPAPARRPARKAKAKRV